MTQPSDNPSQSRRVAIVLTVIVGLLASAVAYLGTRNPPMPASPSAPVDAKLPVQMILLPHEEVELPPGPHQRAFATACTICHSPRLVMTQPPLSRKQWTAVVQKMVKTYGAPITPDAEEQITDYLTTIRGN